MKKILLLIFILAGTVSFMQAQSADHIYIPLMWKIYAAEVAPDCHALPPGWCPVYIPTTPSLARSSGYVMRQPMENDPRVMMDYKLSTKLLRKDDIGLPHPRTKVR